MRNTKHTETIQKTHKTAKEKHERELPSRASASWWAGRWVNSVVYLTVSGVNLSAEPPSAEAPARKGKLRRPRAAGADHQGSCRYLLVRVDSHELSCTNLGGV